MKKHKKIFVLSILLTSGILCSSLLPLTSCSKLNNNNNISDTLLNTIIKNIKTNFENNINTENFNTYFADYNTSINTIKNFANINLDNYLLTNFNMVNNSTFNDNNLKLTINFYINNQYISINIDSSNIINPDSTLNLSYFNIDENDYLISLTEQGLQQEILIIPSIIKKIAFSNEYVKNNFKIVKSIIFGYAREFTGFVYDNTFLNNSSIVNISLDGCNNFVDWKIGTFSRVKNLNSISFKGCNKLTTIPKWGIDNCQNLTRINFDGCSNLSIIRKYAFDNCSKLQSIDFSNTNSFWELIESGAFSNCINLEKVNFNNLSYLNTQKNIFSNCHKLTKIMINSPKLYETLRWAYNNSNGLINKFEDIVEVDCINFTYNNLEHEIKTTKYNENAFIENAYNIANDDSVLFYVVNTDNYIHIYSAVAHMLKVLELNPFKEIIIIVDSNFYNDNKFSFNALLSFKNVSLINTNIHTDLNLDTLNFNFVFTKYINYLLSEFPEYIDRKKILYTADENYFYNFNNELNIRNINSTHKDNLVNTFFQLYKIFNQINIIGSNNSLKFFSNNAYYAYANNNFYFKNQDNYPFLIDIQKNTRNMSNEEFKKWLNEDYRNFYYYLISCYSASKNYNDSDITRVNYYLPYANVIKDINNATSNFLSYNSYFNQYFDPYNSYGLNLVGLISSLNTTSIKFFYNTFKIDFSINYLYSEFEGHYNIIFNENDPQLSDTTIAENLIKIGKINETKSSLPLKIWYLPMSGQINLDWNSIMNEIIKKVNLDSSIVNKDSFIKYFSILNKDVPMEIYLSSNLFKNRNSSMYIKLYASYLPYILQIMANDMKDIILNIVLNDINVKDDIEYYYGFNSITYPNNLLILKNDLFN